MKQLKDFFTNELVEELRNREGVKVIDIEPYEPYFISVDDSNEDIEIDEVGPAIMMIITD